MTTMSSSDCVTSPVSIAPGCSRRTGVGSAGTVACGASSGAGSAGDSGARSARLSGVVASPPVKSASSGETEARTRDSWLASPTSLVAMVSGV